MSADRPPLARKFAELFAWERTKRREKILLTALSYALIASLALSPFERLLSPRVSPLFFPPVLFLVCAAVYLYSRPWSEKDSLAALHALDRKLRLEERALTAAEILKQSAPGPAERHVLGEAGERLKSMDARALFKREWSWQALAAAPLLVLWLASVWLGAGSGAGRTRPPSLAEKLKEFSRELEQKAEAERLAQSLQLARALEKLAEERLGGKSGDRTGDQRLHQTLEAKLAALQKRLAEAAPAESGGDAMLGGYAREELTALRGEIEALKRQLRPGAPANDRGFLDRLQSLPRLSRAIERGGGPPENMGAREMQSLLDRLERGATGELDRRSLAGAEEFLSSLLRGGESGEASSPARVEAGGLGENRAREKTGGQGESVGAEPGAGALVSGPPPPRTGAATRLQGTLGEGESSGFTWRGEAKAGAARVPEEEAAASYRRQVEADLAAEKIPPALKETVKKYFLSLGAEDKTGNRH